MHTLAHPNLTELEEEAVIYQVEEDRKMLSALSGQEVVGMAYPCGGVNNDDRVAEILRKKTGVYYSRTITSSYSFEKQENLYRFNPTVYHLEWEKMFELAEKFVQLDPEEEKVLYIWGHSYELDAGKGWEILEKFCRMISGKGDIFYGTNREVLLER